MNIKAATYSSFSSPGLQPVELEQILHSSKRNNARDSITGVLMFNGAAFVQTIEGPPPAIDALLMLLATDSRHCQMDVCDERMLQRRIFPDWSMGYVRVDGGWLEGQYDVADALTREMPYEIRDLLMSMATTLPFA
ncbi:MAG: BLUF domain-containing protein [Pseudomonadota bacterium]|nr:BLUF domain-containing protein [Pseudomonadota bacterium]